MATQGVLPHVKPQPTAYKLTSLRWEPALVLGAMLLGTALRFANLAEVPPGLQPDEAVYAYDAYSLFRTGRDHHGHPFPWANLEAFGAWSSALLTFLMAPIVGVLGLRVEVLRAVPAAFGVLAIPVVYLLGTELSGRRSVGALAALLIAVSPWHVDNSRVANLPSVVPTMIALTMYLLSWSLHRRSSRGIVAASIAAGLTVGSYHTMKVYLPLLGLASLAIYWGQITRASREALLYASLLFVVIAGPVLYTSALDPGGRARADQVSVFNAPEAEPVLLIRQYLSYFSPEFLFVAGDGDPTHTPWRSGVELWSIIPMLLAGIVWLIRTAVTSTSDAQRASARLLLAALALYPFPGCLTLPSPHVLRGTHVIPLLAVIAAIGVSVLADLTRRRVRTARPWVARSMLPLLCFVMTVAAGTELLVKYRNYFGAYPEIGLQRFKYGLEQALAFARTHEAAYDEIWVTDTNQPYIYVLFYSSWPPSDVHQNLTVRRAPPAFNRAEAIGKYRFSGRPPGTWVQSLPVLLRVDYPNGRPAYEVRGGSTRDRGQVLIVSRPIR